jgi:hypothetical protein
MTGKRRTKIGAMVEGYVKQHAAAGGGRPR